MASDVNGDGKLDLVAATQYNGVYVFMGNGDGTFQTPANYTYARTFGCCTGIAVGDLNGDSTPDLALSANDGISILLIMATGHLERPLTILPESQTHRPVPGSPSAT